MWWVFLLWFNSLGQPSRQPSMQPSSVPSTQPSSRPTTPSGQPTTQPSRLPTMQPSGTYTHNLHHRYWVFQRSLLCLPISLIFSVDMNFNVNGVIFTDYYDYNDNICKMMAMIIIVAIIIIISTFDTTINICLFQLWFYHQYTIHILTLPFLFMSCLSPLFRWLMPHSLTSPLLHWLLLIVRFFLD
jgi:hypothetical protein